MPTDIVRSRPDQRDLAVSAHPERRLERSEILYFPACPFSIPDNQDREFLFGQQLGGLNHKNISFNPETGYVTGCRVTSPPEMDRLASVLADFSKQATTWLSELLPRYAQGWQLDRVSLHPEEEATRKLRQSARNDLLHIDAFPTRPARGRRILRLYVNINRAEPRIWATTYQFRELLEKYGTLVGLPTADESHWTRRIRQSLVRMFQPSGVGRTVYDQFMLRFHNFLKSNLEFQERCPKTFWTFPAGSAWLAFTDSVCHAVMRGQHALEHSYFVAHDTLELPDESPAALLEKATGVTVFPRRAA